MSPPELVVGRQIFVGLPGRICRPVNFQRLLIGALILGDGFRVDTDVLFKEYFAAIPHGAEQFELADGTLATRTDYSLQVAVGIRKFYQAQLSPAATQMVDFPARAGRPVETGPELDEQEPEPRRWLAWMILLAVVMVIAIVWLLRRKA